MSKLLIATATVGMLAALSLAPPSAQADCVELTATAQGATQNIATRQAERKLRRYIRRNLDDARVQYDETECVGWGEGGGRPTCESLAIACR
jgi:hypothetical protein